MFDPAKIGQYEQRMEALRAELKETHRAAHLARNGSPSLLRQIEEKAKAIKAEKRDVARGLHSLRVYHKQADVCPVCGRWKPKRSFVQIVADKPSVCLPCSRMILADGKPKKGAGPRG